MVSFRRVGLVFCVAVALAFASSKVAAYWRVAPPRPVASQADCPNLGVRARAASIIDSGEQDCPAVSIGPGIPFVGQLKIFGLGSKKCPVVQTWFPARSTYVAKRGFRIERGASLPVRSRTVECSTATNLLVIGTSGCLYGTWVMSSARVHDWSERACTESD